MAQHTFVNTEHRGRFGGDTSSMYMHYILVIVAYIKSTINDIVVVCESIRGSINWRGGGTYLIDKKNNNITNYTGDATHNYVTAGTYTVAISRDFPRIHFNNSGDQSKLISIEQWGTGVWTSIENTFYGCNIIRLHSILTTIRTTHVLKILR